MHSGDRTKTDKGRFETVESLEVKSERRIVYNLKIEGTQNYFVGKSKMLVHNGGDCLPELSKLTPKALNELIGLEQRNILKEFLLVGVKGARIRAANFVIPHGLSRETLEIYGELARRALAADSTGVQAERLGLIKRALEQIK